ncbi:hypothetical protein Tsubulata_003446 [Turnera subulata]|uniref:Uncharacterized protein n=1 Tax=Turnera subulata TaxID=218843 RepID=A0A9Q0G798_9ROSI|nr:hypothetical protein Tsubulata_003446 [Turnera subulata]
MEVVVPVPPVMDFNFDSTCSSPYMTAPSSPQRLGNFYYSAPASPTRISAMYREFNDASTATDSSSAVLFDWEERPGMPKPSREGNEGISTEDDGDDCGDFEFDFSGQLERVSLSAADELFYGGKIRPLKPPPCYDSSLSNVSSPRSPRSPRSLFKRKKDFDPFQAAVQESHRTEAINYKQQQQHVPQHRGRERKAASFSSPGSLRKGSRSLSPLRVSDIMFEEEEIINGRDDKTAFASSTSNNSTNTKPSYAATFLSAITFSRGNKKWKLKDLLFRSASEGRATGKDPLMKYAALSKKEIAEDVKNSSFRSTDSVGASSRRRGSSVSAHELHYQLNRAVSEEMKRKTFLPYKRGLLGCLGSNPGVHELSRGVGSLRL